MAKSYILMTLIFTLLIFSVDATAFAQKLCPYKAPVGESGLRKQKATKKVKPTYPEDSLKNRVTGRVVVNILVDENGKVSEAKVNESPDELTGQAVVAAAKQWEFQAPPKVQGRQICYTSTLSFKFEIKDGKGKVVDDPIN
ncbi:MAG: Gram-negative bacterial TonB protein C-terminal [Acidobacteriota bacterium]|jgi:TonB family protein|nr:Gram-negative bacterial TonB protein C-terminal [Acidobacteriota bacterium]